MLYLLRKGYEGIMETIEELQCGGYKILQDSACFKFGTDAVLLADFAKAARGDTLLDLCTGNGIIPILLAAKTKIKQITGIEIQKKSAELAKRSVEMNKLEDRVEIVCGDLKEYGKFFEKRSFDVITCNPPYMKCASAIVNETDEKKIARHEFFCVLEDVVKTAAALLKVNGRFFMVHRPTRLAEIIACMKKNKIEPKRVRFVHPDEKSEPTLLLIEGIMFGGEETRVMPPLFLKGENGEESPELKNIYGRDKL